jgi:hypothetical protein
MPSVPLNTFIEFTVSQGTARVNAATLPSGDYDPRKDFYKRLRERTVRQLVEGWSEQGFRRSIRGLASPRKRASFEACRAGLSSWAQGKEISGRRAPNVTGPQPASRYGSTRSSASASTAASSPPSSTSRSPS